MLKNILKFDFIYLAGVLLLLAIGLISLYSLENSDFTKQFILILIGMGCFFYLGTTNYRVFKSYSTLLYFFSIILLILVLIPPFGVKVNNTVGWLNLVFTRVQPVEFVKVFLIIFLAHFIEEKRIALGELATIVTSFILVSIPGFLILKQPDFGSALVIYGIWLGMIFISGISKKYLIAFIILGITTAFLTFPFLSQFQKDRIDVFLHPELDPLGSGWNVQQAVVAVGNGGLYGKGIGYGSQSQLNFLPEKHTDFIFATIVEATGLVGAWFIIGLFFLIFIRFRIIAIHSSDSFGYFLVSGLMIWLFIHILINIGMNMKVMPVTGIPLPFVSFGGSSIVSVLILGGIVMNVYVRKRVDLGRVITDY